MPNQVYIGNNSLKYLSTLKPEEMAVVVSQSFFASNEELFYKLFGKEVFYITHTGEPTKDAVDSVKSKLSKKNYSYLVGVGGGSVIDVTKIIKKDLGKKMIAVPTTIGSGSEVSQHVVLLEDSKKKPYSSSDFIPEVVLLSPSFVQTLPSSSFNEEIIDALAHGLESLVSRAANPMTDEFALHALDEMFNLLSEEREKDNSYFERLQIASFFAGIAQSSASTGLAHGFAHYIGAKSHIPHAQAVATYLLDSVRLNLAHTDKYDKLNKLKGVSSKDLLIKLEKIFANLAIKPKKYDLKDTLEEVAEGVKKDICTITNPYQPSVEELTEILRKHQ